MSRFYSPDKIVVVLRFSYAIRGKTKGKPNDIRRALLGLKKGSPNIPRKVNNDMDKEVVLPHLFSLIKDPRTYKKADGSKGTFNPAVGAIAVYHYIGPENLLEKTCETFRDIFEKTKTKTFLGWSDVHILAAKEICKL